MSEPITLIEIVRAVNLGVLPRGGAWVCVKGMSHFGAPRNHRIIPAHRDIGIQHMDIYWATDEVPTFSPRPLYRRRRRGMDKYANALMWQKGLTREEALARVAEEYLDLFMGQPFRTSELQATLVTICHPHHEKVRFYNGEVRVFSDELISNLLKESYVETIVFGQANIPVLEEAVRDIVDALQVDGCSFAMAQHEALVGSVLKPDQAAIPNWFYRPTGAFRDTFVEETL